MTQELEDLFVERLLGEIEKSKAENAALRSEVERLKAVLLYVTDCSKGCAHCRDVCRGALEPATKETP